MSLLLNQDFTIYNLRLAYLNTNPDGVAERLITLPTSVLHEPAFRAAGWLPDTAAMKRCYSPPIPTTGAADYFSRPTRQAALVDSPEETHGGLVTGHRGSEDTINAGVLGENERRRRRQKEREGEEDDSSDLSDDSEDEDTAAQSVRFAKMPVRRREGSSPSIKERKPERPTSDRLEVGGPEVKVISPSFRQRTDSLGSASKPITGRPRRDTTTSSEMSSDNDMLDVSTAFKRKPPSRAGSRPVDRTTPITEEDPNDPELDDEEDEEVAEASDLSDEYDGDDIAVPSPNLLGGHVATTSSPPQYDLNVPPAITPTHSSPRKNSKDSLPKLPRLPSNRPMSTVPPRSLLTIGLKGDSGTATDEKPFQKHAQLSGKGEASPLWIKIYYPFSDKPSEPLEVPIRRTLPSDAGPPTVSDLIGLALYRYEEEEGKPVLKPIDQKIGRWELRMVDDGEVEMDFSALDRAKLVTDFTSNNNRPPQRRARDKPWDEFGLVRADGDDDDEAESIAPAPALPVRGVPTPIPTPTLPSESMPPPAAPSLIPNRNPITGPSFALAKAAIRKDSTLLDAPQAPTATSTPRTGAPTTITVHFTDTQSFQTTTLLLQTTADTYIAELFDIACARLRLDKALYVLKVRGTQTVAPSDRTVEALGSALHLDLVRRRFGGVGIFEFGLSGSPGSSSPNAPLELVPNTPPTAKEAKRRKGFGVLQPQPQHHQTLHATASLANLTLAPTSGIGHRYNVLRKLPLSFSGSHPRTLVITPEYLQILPGPGNSEPGEQPGKVTNIHMSSVVGVKCSRKHPKVVRVLVYRERETKRYDFEAEGKEEAERIVEDVRRGVGMGEVGRDDE
ncbi:hypothetical protein B0A48_01893 [Cryoendolithus antarcticus]|uniref:Sin1 middle CRIM domain-containing protein n=1 Tax=Cryoendolithus antarcticus TaxID=1507870 RepID=A0A1V8TQT5_9PEZI|nr:hypothetical protein B0A48_01893 [Cryoendolithus antarcticus]